jgi:hypothetical protein
MYGVYGLVRTGAEPLVLVSALSRIGSGRLADRLTHLRRRILFTQGVVLISVGVWFVLWCRYRLS